MNLFAELKRRNVFRVGIAYVVVAWVMLQVADVMIDNMDAPVWMFRSLLMTLGVGLPIALIVAWFYELTPEGLKRDNEVDRSKSTKRQSGRKLDFIIIALLAVGLIYFFWESRLADDVPESAGSSTAQSASSPAMVSATDRSVAVLPFVNMSSDPEQEYFSDGITEEIINAVVKIPGISVPARTSVFNYKDRQADIREIGLALGVAHVLEGSIRSQGDQVRVTAQLIKVDDGFHLWSETYDRQLENIFAVQEEIAAAIANQLLGELGGGITTVPNQTRNMEAYDLYLQGRAALRQRDSISRDLLTRATEADPDFAPAWAALAIAYQSTNVDNAMAIEMADRALTLDPDNVDALDAKGSALRSQRQWLEAERYFDQALGIDPNSAELLEDYAEFLAYTGRSKEALEVTTRGIGIDQSLLPLAVAHVEALITNGRSQDAWDFAADMMVRFPERGFLWFVALPVWLDPVNVANQQQIPEPPSLPEEAPDWIREMVRLIDRYHQQALTDEDIAQLKASYSIAGILDGGFDRGSSLSRDLLIGAGEVDHVLAVDLELFDTNELATHEWNWTPFTSSLRRHPDFHRYLERAGFIEYWDATQWPDFCQRDEAGVITCQ